MRNLEHKLQVGCVNWFRYEFPDLLIFAIPNGSKRNLITAQMLKAEGVTAGIPDLMIPIARNGFNGLFIEMKNGKAGRVTEAQQQMMEKLTFFGYKTEVAHSFEEFHHIVTNYLKAA